MFIYVDNTMKAQKKRTIDAGQALRTGLRTEGQDCGQKDRTTVIQKEWGRGRSKRDAPNLKDYGKLMYYMYILLLTYAIYKTNFK